MKACAKDRRATLRLSGDLLLRCELVLLWMFFLAVMPQPVRAQTETSAPAANLAPLGVEQVVRNMVEMNLHRLQALHGYRGTRTYRLQYRGFPGSRSAEMVVNVLFTSPATKEFAVQSATGSKLVIDRVFKKLLEAEQEALTEPMQRRVALTPDNYKFTLVGFESALPGPLYILQVEPRTKDKFLYRGRIWVDAADFAVVRLEAEPAKNPSFWTRNTQVQQSYLKVADFWLPARNRSLSLIRLGGQADLTIEYDNYQITSADPVAELSKPDPARAADKGRAQPPEDHP